jgi:Domain of unknown function (DUF4932)
MKSLKLIILLVLFAAAAIAQDKLPTIKSNSRTVSIEDGAQLKTNGWNLTPDAKPDVYEAELIDGKAHRVTFITDLDRISFNVEENKKYDFIIEWGDKICYTQIVGKRFVPAARFDGKYQAANRGKTSVEIPEVYELVNVALAMTATGISDENMIYKQSDYYKTVRLRFDKYRNHPLLAALDAELQKNSGSYFYLKMDGYAFEFNKTGKIVQSKVYDRISWGKSNSLRPFLAQLQSFAEETDFRQFYKQNKRTYREQIAFYRDTADIGEMKKWLDKNFPKSNDYNAYKIIFSPLVAYNQSSNWFESNGFKELQPHVNFPYADDIKRNSQLKDLSKTAEIVYRGDIVFTEINHGYINPEADKYADRIIKATSRRDLWVLKSQPANYYPGISTFNEYMNWALVSLRFTDYVPRAEQDKMIAAIDKMMTKGRGFPKFTEFDKFLVDLYRSRQPNQTVADLYPQIIEWFEKNNQS